jgi:hypothetical protein
MEVPVMGDDLIRQLRNLQAGATVVYHQGWYIDATASPAAAVAMELSAAAQNSAARALAVRVRAVPFDVRGLGTPKSNDVEKAGPPETRRIEIVVTRRADWSASTLCS